MTQSEKDLWTRILNLIIQKQVFNSQQDFQGKMAGQTPTLTG
jgi:hypothetical protein